MVKFLKESYLNKLHSLSRLVRRMPRQLPVIALVLLCWHWSWSLWFGSFSWIVTVTTLQALLVMSCNILTKERWATAVILIELICMLINATLFYFDLHKLPLQDHIMLAAFIIELLIITMSLGAGVGRIRNDGLHNYLNGVGSLFNYSRCNNSGKEVA